jgi:hypothetical protein
VNFGAGTDAGKGRSPVLKQWPTMESRDTGELGERHQVDVPDRPILVYKI